MDDDRTPTPPEVLPDNLSDNPQVAYWGSYLLSLTTLMIVTAGLSKRLGIDWLGPFLLLPSILAAHFVAGRVCRWLGVSKATHAIEVLRRGTAPPDAPPPAPITLKYPPKLWLTLAVVVGAMDVIFAVMLVVAPPPANERDVSDATKVAFVAFLGLLSLLLWVAYYRGLGFIAGADERGVRGYPRVMGFRSRAVGWGRIETCEVTVNRTPTGVLVRPNFVFKDADGRVLLDMLTVGAEEPEARRLQEAVAAYLGAAAGGGA